MTVPLSVKSQVLPRMIHLFVRRNKFHAKSKNSFFVLLFLHKFCKLCKVSTTKAATRGVL